MLLAVSICSPGSDEEEKREKQEQMAVTEGAKELFSEGLLSHLTTAVSLATTIYLVPLYPEIQLCLSQLSRSFQEKDMSSSPFYSVV